MDLFIGIAILIGSSCAGGALIVAAKRIFHGGAISGQEAKQILQELKALRAEGAALREAERTPAASRLERLQQELSALRDTTTAFDLSVDAALTRLTARVEHVEEQVSARSGGAPAGTEAARTLLRR